MPVMIQVTLEDGKGYINASFIKYMATVDGDTRISISGLQSVTVKETPDEIMRKIEITLRHVGYEWRLMQ